MRPWGAMRSFLPSSSIEERDFLRENLGAIPAFRALLRAVECRLYAGADLREPVLDLGCGDGHFSSVAFGKPLTVGTDSGVGILGEAARSVSYHLVLAADATALPFRDSSFASLISNCVLEHIPEVDAALKEASRVLEEGGKLLFTVPSEHFGPYLLGSSIFRALRMGRLARGYARWFDVISRHHHCDPPEVWQGRVRAAGLGVSRWRYYFSPAATRAFDLAHYLSLPALFTRKFTGRWVLWPRGPGPWLAERWLRAYYAEPWPQEGAYIFFACQKVGKEQV